LIIDIKPEIVIGQEHLVVQDCLS